MASSDPLLSHCGRKLHLGAKSLKTGRSIFVHAAQVTDAYRKNAAWLAELASGRLFFHHDQVTSVTAISGHNGGTTQSVKYSAFGQTQSTTGSSPNRLKYTGREEDGTGLMYYRARYYDPALGRFISEDPLGFDGGDINLYQYAAANPINHNDPSGKILPAIAACAANPVCAGVARTGISGLANVAMGGGVALVTGQDYSWKQAGVDFAVGAGLGGLAAVNAARRGAQIQEGIYVASTTTKQGLPYVGQSGQIATRLEQHVASGKITQEVAGSAKVFEVLGGKTSREVAEQRMANQLGGVGTGSLANKVNPIGASRSSLLDDPSLGVISSSNLFNWSGVLGAEAVYQGGMASFSAFGAQPASGGFLLYPNKPNNNMMQSVYSK